MQSGDGNRGMKLLLLVLIIVSIIFFGIGYGAGDSWWMGFFCFIPNIIILIGFVIGLISPPQPLIYMISAIAEAIFVLVSLGIAIAFFVIAANVEKKAKETNDKLQSDIAKNATEPATTMFYVAGAFYLVDALLCGVIAFFCFKVYKTGG